MEKIKYQITLVLFVFINLCSSLFAEATGVTILGTSCEVNGLTDAFVEGNFTQITYQDADALYAAGSVGSNLGFASSTAEPFDLSGFTNGGAYYYEARAASQVVFQPAANHDVLHVNIVVNTDWTILPELSFAYQLTDLTDNIVVDIFDDSMVEFPSFDQYLFATGIDKTYPVDASHQYELAMNIYAGSYDGTGVGMEVIDFVAIPEPGTLCLLVAGSVCLRKRNALHF